MFRAERVHHAVDQVAGVQRGEVDAVAAQRADCGDQRLRRGLVGARDAGAFDGAHQREAQALPGAQRGEAAEVGADHGGDLGIAAGGLGVGEEHDGLAGAGHLD